MDIVFRDETKNLIISDSRYINEAKAIKDKGGLTVVVYRPGYLNDDSNPSESQIRQVVEYCLEKGIDGVIPKKNNIPEILSYYDYFMINDGTLQDLYSKIDQKLIPFVEDFYHDQFERIVN